MKKQLLLFAFSAIALTSCEDDDVKAYEMDMLKGDWRVSKTEIISGKDGKTVLLTDTPTGCEMKDILHFRTDYYVSYTYYSGTDANCQLNGKNEGKFTYNEETKDLAIKFDQGEEEKYIVMILSNSELKVMQLFNNGDANGDGINDLYYTTYKR
ncbi:lipocalin family protein [Chryseobacterium daecheongense]|uniref:lipocalin family protein n=1 Tax=Chryseobacterium daecheongense TaxID=192389 RepID=UPI001FD69144|nr:lipocalin family protein [Chryseobacterium daecheongense]UOU97900.1 lipocalin family protein [Chryseobacterium daecheongense]